jgi:hypothetical protein
MRTTFRVRDISASWAVPGDLEAPVTVVITRAAAIAGSLSSLCVVPHAVIAGPDPLLSG